MKLPTWPCFLLVFFFSDVCHSDNPPVLNSLTMKVILGEQTSALASGFKQAKKPISFHFPRDHLAHQDYRTEWWYFSGYLNTDDLQKFAYQFTLFRFALKPEKSTADPSLPKKSAWRSNNIYMAHVALTDINNKLFFHQERFSRDGLALAGAEQKDNGFVQFWLNDWQIESLQPDQLFPLKLEINAEQFILQLQLDSLKPIVLQGLQGLSQKNSSSASYYYSFTRLASKGELTLKSNSLQTGKSRQRDTSYEVSGSSWFDREWSTSTLSDDQQGWDWFALHLDDGSELMIYQMRTNGEKDRYSSGILIDSQGNIETLSAQQFQINTSQFWQSPVSGIRYPVIREILIPQNNIRLMVSASVKQQEWSKEDGFSFNYWEGAVEVNGIKNNHAVTGSGYLEMTGYD